MLPYARLTPGTGFRPGRAAGYYLQRVVTPPRVRRAASAGLAALLRMRHGAPGWRLGPGGRETLKALRTDGVARLAPVMPAPAVERMRAYFAARSVVGPDLRRVHPEDLPPDTAAAAYPLQTVLACPGLVALINREDILAIAAGYLGCKPTIASVGVRWTFPGGARAARFQEYHRDVDDWRFLKLFVYLTDVDEGSGPHTYVRGSHRTGFGAVAERYEEAQLAARYGPAAVLPILGPCGTSFIADTLGIHRGGLPASAPRLILQVQYSLLPVYAFLYAPQARARRDFDPYCSRLLLAPDPVRAAGDGDGPAGGCDPAGPLDG